jgi:Domain of unknown function (DUF4124)
MNRLHKDFVGTRTDKILAGLAAALLAFSAGTAAAAQLYKWVDERGVVNYSNQPPADPKAARNVKAVEDRVSVYTPDPALVREVALFRQRASEAAYERPSAPPAVVMLGTPSPSPTMVYAAYGDDYPYWYGGGGWAGGGYRPHRPHPSHPISQVRLPPGAIAGNTVGLYSIMPGNSYPVPGTIPSIASSSQPHRPAPAPRDFRR